MENLFKLEPGGIGNYVLLSNIYASSGMWEKVLKLRKLMRWKNLKKDPAHILIETKDGVVHEFFADDGSHPRTREIKEALEELMRRLKLAGYVPNLTLVPYDVSDTEKEQMLMGQRKIGIGIWSVDNRCERDHKDREESSDMCGLSHGNVLGIVCHEEEDNCEG